MKTLILLRANPGLSTHLKEKAGRRREEGEQKKGEEARKGKEGRAERRVSGN